MFASFLGFVFGGATAIFVLQEHFKQKRDHYYQCGYQSVHGSSNKKAAR